MIPCIEHHLTTSIPRYEKMSSPVATSQPTSYMPSIDAPIVPVTLSTPRHSQASNIEPKTDFVDYATNGGSKWSMTSSALPTVQAVSLPATTIRALTDDNQSIRHVTNNRSTEDLISAAKETNLNSDLLITQPVTEYWEAVQRHTCQASMHRNNRYITCPATHQSFQ